MLNIAFLTPLSPQHTGIADYALDLIEGIIKENIFNITVISNANIKNIKGIKIHSINNFGEKEFKDFDMIIYQMGNNYEFHGYMFDVIKKFGGVVHLHDIVLHHLMAGRAWSENLQEDYYNSIKKYYGEISFIKIMNELNSNKFPWDNENIINIPMFEPLIEYSDACIVHSEFANKKIKSVFPYLDVYKIDQLYKMDIKKPNKKTNIIKIGVFGGVDPQKKVDVVLKVFSKIVKKDFNTKFYLTIVGGINGECKSILDLPEKYNLQDNVKITGRVSESEFMKYFSETDIVISLRYPTMGETSAIVMRAMQLGIPCIVNDIGWYSELPTHVLKIPIDGMEEKLEKTILKLLEKDDFLNDLQNESLIYSEKELDFNNNIVDYSNILKSIYESLNNKLMYKQLGIIMKELNYINDSVAYTPVIDKIKDIFEVKV